MASLFERLKADCASDWQDYTHHAFVEGMRRGDLPMAAFQDYLVQDYLFLIHFARAYALAVYKSPDLAAMRKAKATRGPCQAMDCTLSKISSTGGPSYMSEWLPAPRWAARTKRTLR